MLQPDEAPTKRAPLARPRPQARSEDADAAPPRRRADAASERRRARTSGSAATRASAPAARARRSRRSRACRARASSRSRPTTSTAPVGADGAQPDYVNAVAPLDTALAPRALLAALQRDRAPPASPQARRTRNAPRTLDLDLLLYGRRRMRVARLVVPHPRMHERAFVLRPLADIAPARHDSRARARAPTPARRARPAHRAHAHALTASPLQWTSRSAATSSSRARSAPARRASRAQLAEHLTADMLLEQPEDNPFLAALLRRHAALRAADAAHVPVPARRPAARPRRSSTCSASRRSSDFLLDKDPLFARLNLSDDEYALYDKIYRHLKPQAPTPDLVIYLQAPVDTLIERVRMRGVELRAVDPRRVPRAPRRRLRALLLPVRRGAAAHHQQRATEFRRQSRAPSHAARARRRHARRAASSSTSGQVMTR